MKSRAPSAAMELVVLPLWRVWAHSGPTPHMNSAVFERVWGFLKRRSVSHSVWPRLKKGVRPASISSFSLMGVNSTARDSFWRDFRGFRLSYSRRLLPGAKMSIGLQELGGAPGAAGRVN
jgi:hypothetical protein